MYVNYISVWSLAENIIKLFSFLNNREFNLKLNRVWWFINSVLNSPILKLFINLLVTCLNCDIYQKISNEAANSNFYAFAIIAYI